MTDYIYGLEYRADMRLYGRVTDLSPFLDSYLIWYDV
jgi:hypothetical protein